MTLQCLLLPDKATGSLGQRRFFQVHFARRLGISASFLTMVNLLETDECRIGLTPALIVF
jgi:hypothetical protein